MILHLKDLKDSTIRLLGLSANIARYKINIQKSVAFPYANKNLLKKKLGKQTHSQ
jgi:hypothetical protein